MKQFVKEKSVDLDGWIFELFQSFYDVMCDFCDVMCKDILAIIEFSRLEGYVARALNSTFITLISKRNKPYSFNDFTLISLCNMAYKIISKIIANRLKQFLSRGMSK